MRTGYCVMTLGFCGVTFWWRCAMRWGDLWCCRERKGGHSYLESLTVWEWTCIDEWEYADTVDSHAALVCLIESICQERFKELIIRTGLARKSSDPRAVLPWDSRVVPLWLSFLVDLQSCHVAEKTWEYLPWTYCPSILSPRLQKISRKGQKISGVHTGAVVQRVGSHSFATSPGRRLALWLRSWRDWPHHWSGAAYPQLVWKTGHFMSFHDFMSFPEVVDHSSTVHPPFLHHSLVISQVATGQALDHVIRSKVTGPLKMAGDPMGSGIPGPSLMGNGRIFQRKSPEKLSPYFSDRQW